MRGASRSREWAIGLGSLVFLALLSWLPYRVPVAKVNSLSYIFGYNNRVAAGLTALWAIVLAVCAPGFSLRFSRHKPLTRATLIKAEAISGALACTLYLLTRKLDGTEEAIYLIDRIKLLLEGHRPFQDFEFAYGPALLYVPAWLSRWLHLSVGDAYGLFWIASVLIGTFLLYRTLQWVDVPDAPRRPVFLLVWTFSVINLSTFGVSYSLLRYTLPGFLALVVYRRLRKAPGHEIRPWVFLLPALMYAGILLLSQELALAFAVGTVGYLVCFGDLGNRRHLLAFVAGLFLIGMVTLVAARLGLFLTLQSFSTGGFNLPVMPAPHVLLLLLLTGLSAVYVGQRMRLGRPDALLMLIAVSACSLAAALGRCDPLHVFFNPLGITIAGCFVVLGLPRCRVFAWPAMWLVFVGLFSLAIALQVGMQLQKAALPALLSLAPAKDRPRLDAWVLGRMTAALGPEVARAKFEALQASLGLRGRYDVAGRFHLDPGTVAEVPFGFAPGGFGTLHSALLDEGYYFENENVLTAQSVQRKVWELQSHPERPLLLLPGREYACTQRVMRGSFAIREPFFYPYRAWPQHENDILEPLCAYIRDNYHPLASQGSETFGYVLWRRN